MEIRNLNDFIKPPHLPELSDMEALGSIYESPITLLAGEMQTTMEANCLKVVQSYGFDVNAEELAKALAYERDQYDKGYADARKKYERPEGRWIKNKIANLDELGYVLCSNCRCGFQRYERGTRKSELPWIDGQPYELENRCNYCPTCGAKMLNANGPTEEEEHGPQ